MARDDFSADTKRALADRVNNHCCFPGCWAVTLGPSDESGESTSRSGMACHIAAASGGPGARRAVSGMTAEERSSIDNGIWMCYTHGKLIDTDEVRFTIPMLQQWRVVGELRARIEHETGHPLEDGVLVRLGATLAGSSAILSGLQKENETIGTLLSDSCVGAVWGTDIAHAVRDLAIEIARNALTHGAATSFEMRIEGRRIVLTDDGVPFNPLSLLGQSAYRGGTLAVKHVVEQQPHRMLFTSRRDGDRNETVLALIQSSDDVRALTTCAVTLNFRNWEVSGPPIEVLESCNVLYAIAPRYFSFSDAFVAAHWLGQIIGSRRLVVVLTEASIAVGRVFTDAIPGAVVMHLSAAV